MPLPGVLGNRSPNTSPTPQPIPFADLALHYAAVEQIVRPAIDRVLCRGWYVLGEEVAAFEREFAAWLGASHVVGIGSGTDAIHLALRAVGVEPGDEVITAANTCVPTVAGICAAGARPVLADVHPDTLTLNSAAVARAITPRTRAIVPVHLYGHPCEMNGLLEVAGAHDLRIVEDCAQAHGATIGGHKCGIFGDAAAFSFYPTKNLGCFGDGGAVSTHDSDVAARLRKLRNYGERERYVHDAAGFNSRLDALQAAVLRAKLPLLAGWTQDRRARAARYTELLSDVPVQLPAEAGDAGHCYHLYVIRSAQRDALQAFVKDAGIGTLLHYPVPIHRQPAYSYLGYGAGAFPVAEGACAQVLSLPLYPELPMESVERVAEAIDAFFARS